ncbi:DUF4174 domain-containing protein [Haliscomenobacter hydrossis]|uniref:DUF4174 domain-containing protein n=1 Tax=Haliscomenobacter hydrossis (strain ATCC 27775 / DSM 1100 / LMG 10767 / O) TaxID=760192 RepID=F4L4R4_HALH1|nr:DUF4174 domain-containing protein [Haliscomenobacter hydrossis]AEE53012.1 hypothetical protein Halhy_5186 [Haliscomenobacter hydrossis DSM 1100]
MKILTPLMIGTLVFLLGLPADVLLGQVLAKYQWKNRLLLLFAPNSGDTALNRQLTLMQEYEASLNERDVKILVIFPTGSKDCAAEDCQGLYNDYQIDPHTFSALLIGKDGTEKLRSKTAISPTALFSVIDAMPMRREELTRKSKPKGG